MPGLFDYGSNDGGLLGNLNAGFQNFTQTGRGLVPAIASAFTGLATGQRTDPVGMYQQMAGITYNALMQAGVPEPQARLGAINPEVQKAITAKMFPTYAAHNVGNTTGSFNPATGQFQPQYVAPEFKTLNPGDTGISYQPPLMGAAPGPMGMPRPAPIQGTPLAPPPGGQQAVEPPVPGGPGPSGSPAPVGGTQVIAPGMTVQEKAAQEKTGAAMGDARAKLPIARTQAQEAIGVLNKLQTHPGRNFLSTGPMAGLAQYQKGSPQYDFYTTVKQATGGTLLNAIQYFRGTGALSDAEGKAGQEAIARIDAASSKKGLDDAINDYRRTVQKGFENQQAIARGDLKPNEPLNVPGPTQTAPVAQGRTPPAKAIEALKADPSLRGQFDAYYGPGSANKVLGGG